MELKIVKVMEIAPTVPFHFDSTFFKPAHFPTGDTRWETGRRWQTMLWQGRKLGLIFEHAGTAGKPNVRLKVFSSQPLTTDFLAALKGEIIWRFNLELDLSAFYHDVNADLTLRPIIKRFYGLRPMHAGSLYEYLIIDIVLQNATVKRSVTMMQNLFENYGTRLEFAQQKFWGFWEPEVLAQTTEEKLRALKVGYRAKSLIKVSQALIAGEIDELELRVKPAAEQAKTLLALYGIGPASVGYIMFDVFHRWDYLKHISPWEQKIYTQIFFNQDYEKSSVPVPTMLRYFNRWGQWKNLAIHYVWENIWWQRRNKHVPWLEELIRL